MAETTQSIPTRQIKHPSGFLSNRRTRTRLSNIVVYMLLFLGAFILMVPFAWMVSTSLKFPGAVFDWPPEWIPDPFVWSNYPKAWNYLPFDTFLKNTLIITITTVIGTTLSSALVGYSFARLRWIGRERTLRHRTGYPHATLPYHHDSRLCHMEAVGCC